MGRRKREKGAGGHATAVTRVEERGRRGDEEVANVAPGDGALPADKMSSKRRRCGMCDRSSAENAMAARVDRGLRSSWFPEVRWVSRDGFDRARQKSEAASSATSNTSKKGTRDVINETEPSATLSPTKLPSGTHASLLSELNDLKQKLMPAAEACAVAVNERRANTTPEHEFRRARSACNPYECLGGAFPRNHNGPKFGKKSNKRKHHRRNSSGLSQFVNRSAIKLANIDALLGFRLTSAPRRQRKTNGENVPFVFVDMCGAPGGFSEYILYRLGHTATSPGDRRVGEGANGSDAAVACRGFGMSLTGRNVDGRGIPWDVRHLARYHLHPKRASESGDGGGGGGARASYRICDGADGTGSIYNWENVIQLQQEMSTAAPGEGGDESGPESLADLVVADGGFDAQQNSRSQEATTLRIIVSQTASALTLLRPGGIFVLKMFGFQERGTRRMLRHLYDCFDKITFVKPISSRPASAERYLVCIGYAGPGTDWDGFVWREQMMAPLDGPNKTNSGATSLEVLMDSFDLEILQLNVDACRSIIDYLNEKRDNAERGDKTYPHQKRK